MKILILFPIPNLRAAVSATIQPLGQRCLVGGLPPTVFPSGCTPQPLPTLAPFYKTAAIRIHFQIQEANQTSIRSGLMFWKLDIKSIQLWRSSPSLPGTVEAGLSMNGWGKVGLSDRVSRTFVTHLSGTGGGGGSSRGSSLHVEL